MNVRVSGCMITKNEGEYLDQSIESFIEYVDELIIIDDRSTDNTDDIIRKWALKSDKLRIVVGTFNGDKSAQRNEYIKRAKGEWIFCPDGDEVYTPQQMEQLSTYWHGRNDLLFLGVRLLNFWKDYKHVIHGHVWDGIMQRTFRNIEGVGYHDLHHSVSLVSGVNLAKFALKNGSGLIFQNFRVSHYSYTKSAVSIMKKIEYYMRRDNRSCRTEEAVKHYAAKHPYFSERYDQQRYGDGGLDCCGTVLDVSDHVEWYAGEHPEPIKRHSNWKALHDYPIQMNDYMVNHWQYHNHLTHDRHQRRIKFAGSLCEGRTLEVGCANGYSTDLMNQNCKSNGTTFAGCEPTDWGFSEARRVYPRHHFYKFYGENLPFEAATFDTVLQAEIIEHCEDPRRLADEGWRVCKKLLVITHPVNKAGKDADPGHRRFFTCDEMRKFCEPYADPKFILLDRSGTITENESDAYFGFTLLVKA